MKLVFFGFFSRFHCEENLILEINSLHLRNSIIIIGEGKIFSRIVLCFIFVP